MIKIHHSLIVAGLAIGSGASPAMADDNVTIYGVIDTFLAHTRGGGGEMTAIDGRGGLSGSRLGFKGSEDLGNGLKAIYTLEYSISPDANAGIERARQQWVGVQGRWGRVTGGFQYAPGYLVGWRFDPLEGSGLIAPRGPLSIAGDYTISSGSRARWSNSVSYASPDIAGLKAYAIFSNFDNEGPDGASKDDRWGVGGLYKNGPVDVALVYHNVGAGSEAKDTHEYYIAGSYDFGTVRVMGTWQQKNAAGSTSADSKLYSVGAVVALTKSTALEGGFARLDPRGGDNNGNSATVGLIHYLSKRTSLYAAYNRLHYDDLAQRRSGIERAVDAGEAANTYLAGIRHKF